MAWKCPQCGVEGLDDALGTHDISSGGCGFVKVPFGVALRSTVSEKEIEVRIPTVLGQLSMKVFADSDLKYASTEQFRLEKNLVLGGWVVTAISWASNPTFLNGAPLPSEGTLLRDGDVISIGDGFFKLAVRLLV